MRTRYVVVTPTVGVVKKKTKVQQEWASERMARALFSGRDPKEAKSAEATYSRLSKLLTEVAPGYDYKLFKGCHLAENLLERNSRNVDLCVITALRRYCLLMPDADYPCEIRSWPWDAEQMDRWVAAHKAEAEKDLANPTKKRRESAPSASWSAARAPSGFAVAAAASSGSSSSGSACSKSAARAPSGSAVAAAASSGSSSCGSACSKKAGAPVAPCAPPTALYSKWADAPG